MALIKCPECGSDISTLATTCPKCGYPVNTIDRKASQQNLNNISQNITPKGKSYPKIIIWALILTFLIIIALVYNKNKSSIDRWLFGGAETPYISLKSNSAPVYVPTVHTNKLVEGSIIVKAGVRRIFEFSTPTNSINNRISGRFTASGGTGNDVHVFVLTHDDYTNLVNGHSFNAFYDSGLLTVSNINVSLPPGPHDYVLSFSNRISFITDKEVTAYINLFSTY
jgi:hypothetical protein